MSQLGSLANVSPYNIQGALNFGQVPAPGDYAGAYANALSLNQQNYANIMSGYQGLTSSVLGNLKGIDASQRQAITDSYAQQSGAASQSMISRGLGNSTVQDSVQRGLSFDRTKADIALTNQTQQLYAGYQANLGSQQLGFMNSVSAPYPDVNAYNRYGMMQGANRVGLGQNRMGGMPYGGGFGGGGGGVRSGGGGFSGLSGGGSGGGYGNLAYGYLGQGGGSSSPWQADQSTVTLPGGGGGYGGEPGVDVYGGGIDTYGNPQPEQIAAPQGAWDPTNDYSTYQAWGGED